MTSPGRRGQSFYAKKIDQKGAPDLRSSVGNRVGKTRQAKLAKRSNIAWLNAFYLASQRPVLDEVDTEIEIETHVLPLGSIIS